MWFHFQHNHFKLLQKVCIYLKVHVILCLITIHGLSNRGQEVKIVSRLVKITKPIELDYIACSFVNN